MFNKNITFIILALLVDEQINTLNTEINKLKTEIKTIKNKT